MSGKVSKTSKFAACVLIFFNLIAMIFSIFMFTLGLWIITSPGTFSSAIHATGSDVLRTLLSAEILSVKLGVGLAVVAVFIFFISFMGLYGAICRSLFLLFMYSTLVLLLMLLECALMYYFTSNFNEKGIQEQDGQWSHALRLAFKCCELNYTTSQEVQKLPWSCCGVAGHPDNCTSLQVYNKNCNKTISNWLYKYQTAAYASLAALHIILSSCSLIRRSRSPSLSGS